MTHNLFGSASLVGNEAVVTSARNDPNFQVGGTGQKWHGMKARFRPLFNKVELVEDWYNRLAPPRIKEKFRNVMKLLYSLSNEEIDKLHRRSSSSSQQQQSQQQQHQQQAQVDRDPAEWHRANHVLRLYGDIFADQSKDRVVAFLYKSSQSERDMFGDACNSILNAMPHKTQTKSTWLPLDRLADQPDRERFHRVIDWKSHTAAEKVRAQYVNPMDKKHLGVEEKKKTGDQVDETLAHVPTQLKMGKKRTIGAQQALLESARALVGDSENAKLAEQEVGEVAAELTKQKKSYLELSGGRYEVDQKSGATLFQVKGNAVSSKFTTKGQSSMKERIVAAAGCPSHSWKSTTKDSFPNLSMGMKEGMSHVKADDHPCVARYTAATCMVVPSLKANKEAAIPSRMKM